MIQSDNADIDSIIQYQHKILRKYTMMGQIQYCDAPFFHDMVDQKDYKMISIFEVFAINRDEDDFLENLGLFSECQNEPTEDSGSMNTIISKDDGIDLSNPHIKVLYEFKD